MSRQREMQISYLYEASLLRLQGVEVLSHAALAPAQCLVVHLQLLRVRRQLRHLLGQAYEKRPILTFDRLQVRVVVSQRVEQGRLHPLQAQKVTVVVRTVGVDEDVDAGAVASFHSDQGIGFILIGGDVG